MTSIVAILAPLYRYIRFFLVLFSGTFLTFMILFFGYAIINGTVAQHVGVFLYPLPWYVGARLIRAWLDRIFLVSCAH